MSGRNYGKVCRDGLWNNNQALVALLGMCPLLAVSNTLMNGLGLGLATTLTLICSNKNTRYLYPPNRHKLRHHWSRRSIRLKKPFRPRCT